MKVCVSPAVSGNRPALGVATPLDVLLFTTSTPSTRRISAPRARLAAVAGEPGSVYATTTRRGGTAATITSSAPYPGDTPDCENAFQAAVSKVKWKRSFGLPDGVVAVVFRRSKYAGVVESAGSR